MKTWQIITPIITVFALSAIAIRCGQYQRQDADILENPVIETKELSAWIKEFKDDAIAATSFYQDKAIIVKGKVLRIEDRGVGVNLLLGDGSSKASLTCQFELNQLGEANRLEPPTHQSRGFVLPHRRVLCSFIAHSRWK
jgi:hypothetical protein